ncbi:MAG: transporter substrate-binding protein [Glaciihabitans sp.]|jgi:ribose transport system substrate-binding protein|nr:transporter substrate-binding protein [Glaciihabitans sp.]MCU1535554.1 transporter substrate-binding protein [Glaciihabitans sp.]
MKGKFVQKPRTKTMLFGVLGSLVLVLTACAPGSNTGTTPNTGTGSTASANPSFDQKTFDTENAQRTATFTGDPATPWLQYLPGAMVDASKTKLDHPGKVCFSNAALSNTWRQTGWITMQQQLKVLQSQGVISKLEARNAQDSDDTQVADIDYFINENNCDAYIIAPNSPKATAGAVERACATGKPVIIFDRGAGTDCETSFVHSVGGYAWGIDSASFIAANVKKGGHVVALRTAPGVDVFEQRWAAAQHIFEKAGLKVTDYLTGADPAKIKSTLSDEIAKGTVDAVWVDLGDQAVPAVEAFEDAGKPIPVVTGEDVLSYLRAWKAKGFKGFAPVYSAYQWRTALIAVGDLFQGKEIPKDWVLPQVPVPADKLDAAINANKGMPDGHYASFGGEDLPGYPTAWQKP